MSEIKKLRQEFESKNINTWRQLSREFRHIDADGNKSLSKSELCSGLKDMGISFTSSEMDQLMKEIDKNNDGNIDFHEFAQIMFPEK